MLAVSVVNTPPLKVKSNNYVAKTNLILSENRFVLSLRTLCGVNSSFLISRNTMFNIMSNVYCIFLGGFVIITYFVLYRGSSVEQMVIMMSRLLAYAVFNIGSLILSKKKLKKYFNKLNNFDEQLNIKNDLQITTSMKNINMLATLMIITNGILICVYFQNADKQYFVLWVLDAIIVFSTYNLEQVFYINMIRMVYTRVVALKGHAIKLFCVMDGGGGEGEDVEMLAGNKLLDTPALHHAYETLHECSSILNQVLSLPVLTILVTSGLTTISMLSDLIKYYYQDVMLTASSSPFLFYLITVLNSTILLVLPCYYASITGSTVSIIRRRVHDAISMLPMEKPERRRVKAFLDLTKSSRLELALFGVIRLDMALPLTYMSLCTTYLVIVIQFSKFLD